MTLVTLSPGAVVEEKQWWMERRVNVAQHISVMCKPVLASLQPRQGETIVDATWGGGGYSIAALDATDIRIIAIDRDPDAVARSQAVIERYADRLHLCHGRFSEMEQLVESLGIDAVDGVMFDLGVSSPQLDTAERGFSFQHDGPLDMRMGLSDASAAEVVNNQSEAQLAALLRRFGEERRAKAIARAIVKARQVAPIERTGQLADIVAGVLGFQGNIHPATRTFQALRIYVNEELSELAAGLAAAERLLRCDGRLVVVSFHSLEDRIVKHFLALRSATMGRANRHQPEPTATRAPSFRLLHRGVQKPDEEERQQNVRARSARLRAAIRTDADPWPEELAA